MNWIHSHSVPSVPLATEHGCSPAQKQGKPEAQELWGEPLCKPTDLFVEGFTAEVTGWGHMPRPAGRKMVILGHSPMDSPYRNPFLRKWHGRLLVVLQNSFSPVFLGDKAPKF